MQAFPPELTSKIMVQAVRDIPEREKASKAKGRMARVNKRWREILYDTPELWDVVFVHFRMDTAHIKLVCELASKTSAPAPELHISSETEYEPDADPLEGCESMGALATWVMAVAGLLAPAVAKSHAIRVDAATPHGIFLLLGGMGVQHAAELQRLKCYATNSHADNFNYLQFVLSRRLQHLTFSRLHPFGLVPIGQSPNLLRGVTYLRTVHISHLVWDQMKAILTSCEALEELDVADIDCRGDPGTAVIHMPRLRTLVIDISDPGCLQLAAIILTPGIVTLVVRGVSDSPWARFILVFGDAIRSVKNCCICTWVYTESIKALIGELHAAQAIDLRAGGSRFLDDLTLTHGIGRPPLTQIKRWIVSAHITVPQAKVLFNWPEASVESIYSETRADEEYRFMRWEQADQGYDVRLVQLDAEPYFE